jgi:hypothetical protein
VKSGQFYKGMINGVEQSYESPDILQVLPSSKLNQLWDLDAVGVYNRAFKSERVISKTVVEKAVPDEHGRDGVTNHTVLYRFDAFTFHDGVRYKFDEDQFIQDIKDGKFDFEMPLQPELKKPLSVPSPIKWEDQP